MITEKHPASANICNPAGVRRDHDEVVDSHLKHGRVVQRLLLASDVGR